MERRSFLESLLASAIGLALAGTLLVVPEPAQAAPPDDRYRVAPAYGVKPDYPPPKAKPTHPKKSPPVRPAPRYGVKPAK